jgi:long-chain acyl-CoA synthetase
MNLSALPDQRAAENALGPAVADDKTDLDNTQHLAAVQRAAASCVAMGYRPATSSGSRIPCTARCRCCSCRCIPTGRSPST